MTVPVVAPIVEGHGEVTAVRELITRIAAEFNGAVRWPRASPPAWFLGLRTWLASEGAMKVDGVLGTTPSAPCGG